MTTQQIDKVRHKLDCLTDWSPEALDEELAKWTPEEVTKLWKLLKDSFEKMCQAFGIATPTQRVSLRGVRTHQQIKRLMVLQRHATGVSNQMEAFNIGDIVYTSWGYDQTQNDFAQIVEISKTRKTIIAMMMKAKTVDTTRTSSRIVPTEIYGKRFRLYVREGWRGQPAFVGQYPYINGNHDDKRMGCFTAWEGNPVSETNTQYGH